MRYPPFSLEAASKAGVVAALLLTGGLLTGCQTDGPSSNPISELAAYSGKKDDAAKEPPMTRARVATECWMKLEKGRADASLDKRADLVTKCIDEKLKTVEAPKT